MASSFGVVFICDQLAALMIRLWLELMFAENKNATRPITLAALHTEEKRD